MSIHSINNSGIEKKNERFNIVAMGSGDQYEKLILNAFPILLENFNIRKKYLNRFDLSIRERISFPEDFLNVYYPRILDKLINIDILILTYNISDNLSFECLKKFYYLYFTKMDEEDKPKNVIIIETDNSSNEELFKEEKLNQESAKKLSDLFNAHFCDSECDEEKLYQVLNQCLKKLLEVYNYTDDYSTFKYKDIKKEIHSYILIYGDKSSQTEFLDILLKSKFFPDYKKIKSNIYEIKYEKTTKDNNKLSFKILLKLVNNDCYYDSECNIFLYDINKVQSYNSLKNIIREFIKTNGPKFKRIYELFAINDISNNEDKIKDEIKKGKNLSYELGANFSLFNTNNNDLFDNIKIKFDSIFEQIISFINLSNNDDDNDDFDIRTSTLSNQSMNRVSRVSNVNIEIEENYSLESYIREMNNNIQNHLKDDKKCIFNICHKCLGQLNIRINELSNIVIVCCEKCKTEPVGLNIDDFMKKNKKNQQFFSCKNCHNPLNFNIKEKKF